MKFHGKPLIRRALVSSAVGALALAALTTGAAHADQSTVNSLGFTPITDNALACSANGLMQFANDQNNHPVMPTVLMQAGDAATPVNAVGFRRCSRTRRGHTGCRTSPRSAASPIGG